MTVQLPPMPPSIEKLPRDERGYPVPWFVASQIVNGVVDFRVTSREKHTAAISKNLCWVCGQPFVDNILAFVTGPMCAINRTSAEPPSHLECAEFSVKACPFLTKPKAVRREANMPTNTCEAPGFALMRNPGVSLIWVTNRYRTIQVHNGQLIKFGPPQAVQFWSEGRKATREEILESIDTGLPHLEKLARSEGTEALADLNRLHQEALALLPA